MMPNHWFAVPVVALIPPVQGQDSIEVNCESVLGAIHQLLAEQFATPTGQALLLNYLVDIRSVVPQWSMAEREITATRSIAGLPVYRVHPSAKPVMHLLRLPVLLGALPDNMEDDLQNISAGLTNIFRGLFKHLFKGTVFVHAGPLMPWDAATSEANAIAKVISEHAQSRNYPLQ